MKQLFSYLFSIAIGLLVLIILEGMSTLGWAFHFEDYNWMGYTIQGLLVYITIYCSIKLTDVDLKN